MANRKGFIKYITDNIDRILPNNPTKALLVEKFKSMSDKEIDQFYQELKEGKRYIPYYVPSDANVKIDIKKWVKLAEELGYDVFSRIVQEDPNTKQITLSEVKYWVALFPTRRHIQYLDSKRSIAKDNKTRDVLTGQVTGESKGSSFSRPQLMGLLSRGMTSNALEIYKYQGGDIAGGREFNNALINGGGVSLENLLKSKTLPTSTKTLGANLNGMHLAHNLTQ